jgi:hypothetical protein
MTALVCLVLGHDWHQPNRKVMQEVCRRCGKKRGMIAMTWAMRHARRTR